MIHNWNFTTIGLSQRQARVLFLLIRLFVEWLGEGEDFAGGFALAQPETWEESALTPLPSGAIPGS